MLIEPTETESIETLDAFADALIAIAAEAETSPDVVLAAPHTAPVRRLDEATAARQPNLRWRPMTGARDAVPRLIRPFDVPTERSLGWKLTVSSGAVDSTGSAPTRSVLMPLLAYRPFRAGGSIRRLGI